MAKKKIFISSVQLELSSERIELHEYICADPLLGKFFEPFLFELLPAIDQKADAVYLKEVEYSDIYLGIFGKEYGSENSEGISPTELEFNQATKLHKTRLVFLTNHGADERHSKENQLISKAQKVVIRKKFSTVDQLKSAVYAALVRYLEEKEIIRTGPFDASLHETATLNDIDDEKIKSFVRLAQSKRGFPIAETEPKEKILTHLNLLHTGRVANAAILLFGNAPQRFFINSEVRCASFSGTIVEKPIPSYKVFKGSVFELVDQALEFVLNKLDYRVETRAEHVAIPGSYEIPKEVIAEAIVNAIAHRDYTSNGSVQVMLFRDRLEIWNPGSLPLGWTTEKLKQLHTSVPANPLLAEPLYLAGYIERMGTGTSDIVQKSLAAGLAEPQFIQTEDFQSIVYRPAFDLNTPQVPTKYRRSTDEVPQEFRSTSVGVRNLIKVLENEMNRQELQEKLELKHEGNFRENHLDPSLDQGFIVMIYPETPNHPDQRYRLSALGVKLRKHLVWYSEYEVTPQVTPQDTPQDTPQVTPQVTPQDTMQVEQLIAAIDGVLSRNEIQEKLELKDREYFRKAFINAALNLDLIEMTIPDKPNSRNQKYRLTAKGNALKEILKERK